MKDIFAELDDLTASSKDSILRPPIKYIGSKSSSLGEILPYLPYRKIYCEPFGGSAAVLIARKPSPIEIYNDRYGGLVAFFKCLRDPVKSVLLEQLLQQFLYAREEFIWCKKTWETCESDVDRAARWYVMHQMSWGSAERNWGRGKTANQANSFFNNLPNLKNISKRMRNVQVENQDWSKCLRDYDTEETVFYIDPPYIDAYEGTYGHELSHNDHRLLLETIHEIMGYVAVSGFHNPLYDNYPWSNVIEWDVYSGVEGKDGNKQHVKNVDAQKGSHVREVLWIKE